MKWFIYAVKKTFNYQGRARRAEFGWFYLTNFLIQIGAVILFGLVFLGIVFTDEQLRTASHSTPAWFGIFIISANIAFYLFQFAMWLTSLSLTARRLHDLGWSGWWQLMFYLAPLVITVPFGLFMMQAGTQNRPLSQSDYWAIYLMSVSLLLYVLGALIVIGILFFKDGQRKTNKYGADPKAEEYATYAKMQQQEANSTTTAVSL